MQMLVVFSMQQRDAHCCQSTYRIEVGSSESMAVLIAMLAAQPFCCSRKAYMKQGGTGILQGTVNLQMQGRGMRWRTEEVEIWIWTGEC